jgi:hypothetical protein
MDIMVMNSLKLHPDKTRLIEFGRPWSNEQGRKRGTFDFLGFTFHWGKTLKGYWAIKKKTARKRLSRFMKQLWRWCKANRHEPIGDQHLMLISKLRGFYQYFGVRGNYKALEVVFETPKRPGGGGLSGETAMVWSCLRTCEADIRSRESFTISNAWAAKLCACGVSPAWFLSLKKG